MTLMLTGTWSHSSARTHARISSVLHQLAVTGEEQAVHGVQVPGSNSLRRPFLRVDDGFLRRHVRVTLGTGRRGGSILHLVRVPVAADAPLVAAEFRRVGGVAEGVRGVVHVAVAPVTRRVPVERHDLVVAFDAGFTLSEPTA